MPRRIAEPAGLTVARLLLAVAVVAGGGGPPAVAEPVTTVWDNGDPANRVDLAILGDGYTAAELDKYASDVAQLVQQLFAQEPFQEYQRYFNVHRVDVVSNESGADHPERDPPVSRDTALHATYNCGGIQRLICVNVGKVLSVASQSLAPVQRDILVVLVNDPEYGGSGGAIAVASTHPMVSELTLHELGHSFGLLADEYGGPPPPACDAALEPPVPNVTKETERGSIKWTHWIDPDTPIPTPTALPGVPGLYEGARYCDAGLYRPTYDSKMRTLAQPFEQVNGEQLVKRVYNLVSPVDATLPAAKDLTLTRREVRVFEVVTPAPSSHSLTVTWTIDGRPAGSGLTFTFQAAQVAPGLRALAAVVSDPTPMVRSDPSGLLRDQTTWNLTVLTAFTDVPAGYWAGPWIEALHARNVTGGCATLPLRYCPETLVTREQMAVFLLKAKEPEGYVPPGCIAPTFSDMPCANPFAAWVEELVRRGVTAGCGAGRYCPGTPISREQMAVFLLRAKEGPSYTPPPCTAPVFADVPCASPFSVWVQELVERGVTAGCGAGLYCPAGPVTRAQMAVFLVSTFDLPL